VRRAIVPNTSKAALLFTGALRVSPSISWFRFLFLRNIRTGSEPVISIKRVVVKRPPGQQLYSARFPGNGSELSKNVSAIANHRFENARTWLI
jgi:hypothetical protein